jgi:hypothetical protein
MVSCEEVQAEIPFLRHGVTAREIEGCAIVQTTVTIGIGPQATDTGGPLANIGASIGSTCTQHSNHSSERQQRPFHDYCPSVPPDGWGNATGFG